jgi:hypothetical protein
MRNAHTEDEAISVEALEGMVALILALIDCAAGSSELTEH